MRGQAAALRQKMGKAVRAGTEELPVEREE
jgi:hypothetical protein